MDLVKINYQKQLDDILLKTAERSPVPTLLLLSCCAPCSSYVLEYLSSYFKIILYYYNPNIYPEEEYRYRTQEQQQLIAALSTKYPVTFLEGDYDTARFYETVRGLENTDEGGERCFRCYRLRLEEAAVKARELQCDYFTTTLSVSPYKNAQKLNEIGRELSEQYGIPYLYSDFKKKNGYQRSIALSKEYNLYRQDYCGCVFSKQIRQQQTQADHLQTDEPSPVLQTS